MDILSSLQGISPMWWVAFAILLGIVEMTTMSFFLIWPALAALCTAIVLAISPEMSGTAQTVLFAVLAIGLTFGGRSLMARAGGKISGTQATLNQRSEHVVGRNAKVLDCADGQGNVEIDGMQWRAKWMGDQNTNPGNNVKIIKAEGMLLLVE